MERRTIVRTLRALRRRKRWSQTRTGRAIGISQSEMSRWECGDLATCSVEELEKWARAVGADLTLDLRVNGVRPLTDAAHARLQNLVAEALRAAGWIVEPEVSFNQYGDRGRIDLLAYHPERRILLVIEIKTRLVDSQEVLGALDVKRRTAILLAKERGWSVDATVPAIVFSENRTIRRRVADHEALFAGFNLRGRSALSWLRDPDGSAPAGILVHWRV